MDRNRWWERIPPQQSVELIPGNGPLAATPREPFPPDAGHKPSESGQSHVAAVFAVSGGFAGYGQGENKKQRLTPRMTPRTSMFPFRAQR